MLDIPPWAEGVQVEVRLTTATSHAPDVELGLVIIAGFGLAGRWVADIFDRHKIDYVVVEKNPDTVQRQQLLGRRVILGDISDPSTLQQANILEADILALTIPDEEAVLRATELARRLNPRIYIVARTQYTSAGMEATQLGADAVVKAEQAVAHRFYELLLHKVQTSVNTRSEPTPL
ncbi:MAG: Glutathione-regulated potassium-efflux system protein KefC [Phycisphaerae bacterium]|nr:Glutathione-regulated potassium-efflux system protein KefC [Phycisphaerae bacterium]